MMRFLKYYRLFYLAAVLHLTCRELVLFEKVPWGLLITSEIRTLHP